MTSPDVTGQHREHQHREHLGARRARIAGQRARRWLPMLMLDHPETVQTPILLELSLFSVPSGEALIHQAGPASEASGNGTMSERWPAS